MSYRTYPPLRLLLGICVGLGRVIELARLNDEFLIVIRAVPINVHTHFELVLFPIAHVTGIERKTVLTTQQSVDAAEHLRQLAFERHRKIRATSFLRERLQRVVRLQKTHAAGHSGETV